MSGPEFATGFDRAPPFSIEAETSILGAALIDRDAIPRALEFVSDGLFYREAHRRLFRGMVRLYERSEAIDVITLSEDLRNTGELDAAGGLPYLAELLDAVPTAANVEYHAKIVRDRAQLRSLIELSSAAIRDAYDPGDRTVQEIFDEAEQRILSAAEGSRKGGLVKLKDSLWGTFESIEKLQDSEGGISGVASGFSDLDRMTTGFQKGDLVIVAGRPSMGKTAWSLNVAATAAIGHSLPTAVFSLEMSRDQLTQRFLCAEGRVDSQNVRRGRLSPEEYQRLAGAAGHLNTAPIWIDDSPIATVLEIRATCRRLQSDLGKEGKGLGLVLVDYIQLMTGGARSESRIEEISAISRGLKALARELDTAVVAISQLSRNPDQRPDKRPVLSDLRDCLPGDATIDAVDGRRVPVSRIVDGERPEVWAIDERGKMQPRKVVDAWVVGERDVCELRTRTGRRLRATPGHRVMTSSGWKEVGDLKPGEWIALTRKQDTGERTATMSAEMATLLGWLIGDGNLQGTAELTVANKEMVEVARALVSSAFGMGIKSAHQRRDTEAMRVWISDGPKGPGGNPATNWLREIGAWGHKGIEKRIPEIIFTQPNDIIAAFLRGLFHADGSLKAPKKGSRISVSFSTICEGIARDVQVLLQRLGMGSSVHRQDHTRTGFRASTPWIYAVHVGERENVSRFIQHVGFLGSKQDRAEGLVSEKQNEAGSIDRLPPEVNQRVRELKEERGLSWRQIGWREQGKAPTRSKILEVGNRLRDAELIDWATSDLTWDRVERVEPSRRERVYDITVEGLSCFVSGGIVCHNSGAIEQDADAVLFLYRPEYYAPQEKKAELEGVAELIVAKQRNGPTGTVGLYWHKHYTRFESVTKEQLEPEW